MHRWISLDLLFRDSTNPQGFLIDCRLRMRTNPKVKPLLDFPVNHDLSTNLMNTVSPIFYAGSLKIIK